MKQIIDCHAQILKDLLKRKYVDFIKGKSDRLQTPMQIQIKALKCYKYLPPHIIAIELFGMHGLWITRDYADICEYLEFWEINHIYARAARKFIKNAVVIEGDSISAVQNKKLMRTRYNFIISDNPAGAPYGNNYYEHFNLFPKILDYLDDEGLIQLNFINNPYFLNSRHMEEREAFYGKAKPNIAEASDVYSRFITNSGAELRNVLIVPRSDYMVFMTLVIRGGKKDKNYHFA